MAPPSDPVVLEAMQTLLDQVSATFLSQLPTHSQGSVGSAAIHACIELMKPNGGKLHYFGSDLPTVGVKSLKAREAEWTSLSSKADKPDECKQSILASADLTFKSAGMIAAGHQICIDVVLLTQVCIAPRGLFASQIC